MRNRTIIMILIIIIAVLVVALAGAITYIFMLKNQNNSKNNNNQITDIIDAENVSNEYEEIAENEQNLDTNNISSANETVKLAFNALFENYIGNNLSVAQVKTLLARIETNNEDNTNRKVTVDTSGITKTEELDTNKTYSTKMFYDNEGYVSSVKITENAENSIATVGTDLEKIIFNTKFTKYAGELSGSDVNKMLQEVMQSNNTNPNHQISISSSTLGSLEDISEAEKYIIEVNPNNDTGWVDIINIDKK